ncbi:MAG: OmpA family protein [candidate division Zixibacteria bacterium]
MISGNIKFRILEPIILTLLGIIVLAGPANSLELEQYEKLTALMDSALVNEVNIFAPEVWKKAQQSYEKAKKSVDLRKKQKEVDKNTSKATEYVENAIKAAEVGKLTLKEYLEPRNKAIEAQAPIHVLSLYSKAEQQFLKATLKAEKGDVKGALKEAEKSNSLFDVAELEAIKIEIMGKADKLIAKAIADDAGKYALSTLDKAQTARQKTDALLSGDRYNRKESVEEANRAEYEARHASDIALSVRSLNRNDQAWEKLMLLYEIQMNRVGQSLGMDFLPFDEGPSAAAELMIRKITELENRNSSLSENSENLTSGINDQLSSALTKLGVSSDQSDPVPMAQAVNEAIDNLLEDKAGISDELVSAQQKLTELESSHEQVEAALAVRVKQEEKFKKAKTLLNPSEGEVLFNSSNDVVLRLGGLSFDIGKSKIKDEHIPLLEKVKEIIKMFPEAELVVEGHTDASGDPLSNMQLSEKRAFAVMQYLRQSLLISADKIMFMGYGSDRPIASNQTEEGRSKNRRIDIIIMR